MRVRTPTWLPAPRREVAAHLIGYAAVSAIALCVDFIIYWSLLSTAKYAFVSAIGGYICGVITHYALSSRVVFGDRFQVRGLVEEAPTIARFFAAGAVGLVITAAIVGLLSDIIGIHPLIAKLAASGCSFLSVFVMLRVFVFNRPASSASPAF